MQSSPHHTEDQTQGAFLMYSLMQLKSWRKGVRYIRRGLAQKRIGQREVALVANSSSEHVQILSLFDGQESIFVLKQCAILIYLKSTAGKIPAGTVALNISRTTPINNRELCSIDKCPDKNAIIQFDFSFEKLEGKLEAPSESLIQKVLFPIHTQSMLRKSTSRENIRSPRVQQRQHSNSSQIRYLRGSKAEGSIVGKSTLPLRRMPSKNGIETRYSLLEDYYAHERQRDSSKEKIFGLQREVEGTKTKLSLVQQELSSKTNRVIQLEKQGRQYCKKIESLELQLRASASKLQMLEKSNRELTNQTKQMKQKQEQERLNFENALKRVQIRQISSKEQIKSLTQKLYASENQKQKMLFEKSSSYNQFEERQKKLRQAFKDKEKKMIEQKANLLKKIDNIERQALKYSQQLAETKTKNNEALQTTHQLQLIVETLEAQNQRYRNEVSDIRYELTKSRNERKILEENLENNNKFNQQRRNYRKQINQKDMQILQLKEQLIQLENNSSRAKISSEEAQKAVKQKNTQVKLLERDYAILAKEHNFITSELNSKELKLSSALEELQSQMKKSKALQTKVRDFQDKLQEQKEALEMQCMENKKRCAALQEEIEKLNNDLFECHSTINSLEKQNEELEQAIDQKNEVIHNLESNLIQLNDANQSYQLEKLDLAEQRKQMEENLLRQIEDAQNQIKQISSQLLQLKQLHSAQSLNASEQLCKQKAIVNDLNQMVKEKDEQIVKTNSKTSKLERQLQKYKSLVDENGSQIRQKQSLIAAYSNEIKCLKQRYDENQLMADTLRNENLELENQIRELNTKLDQAASHLQIKEKDSKEAKIAFQDYKTMSIDALNILNSEIDQLMYDMVIEHCDQEFQNIGNDILKKMVVSHRKISAQMRQQQRSIVALHKQISKMEEEKEDKQLHLLTTHKDLQLLKKSSHQFNCELQSKAAQVEMLRSESKKKEEEFVLKLQQYEAKISLFSKSVTDKNKQIADLKQKLSDAQSQLEQSQQTINQLENSLKKIEKQKKSVESENRQKVSQIDSTLRLEIEKVNALETEKANLEKELAEEKKNVKKVMRELQNKCFEHQQKQRLLEESQNALTTKENQCNRFRLIYNELKQIHQSLISNAQIHQITQFSTNKFEALLTKTQYKEHITLFDKTRQFYHSMLISAQQLKKKEQIIVQLEFNLENLSSQLNSTRRDHEKLKVSNLKFSNELKRQRDEEIVTLSEEKTFFQNKANALENEIMEREKQRVSLIKQMEDTKIQYEQLSKMALKQKQFVLQVIKFVQEHKDLIQLVRKLASEITKTLGTLEKEKKVSMFAVSPLRDPLNKVEDILGGLYKSTIQMMSKHKREWDLASFRKKKLQKKVSLQMKPI